MKWSEVIGQDEIKAQLDRLIISNRVPHAQLFMGIRIWWLAFSY